MKKANGSVVEVFDTHVEEKMLFTYDEKERQQNEVNKANAKSVFAPAFIPVNPKRLKFLTPLEALVLGFIEFYTQNGSGKFYFTNEQLAEMLECSEKTITRAVAKLEKLGVIRASRRVKSGGGQIRFIRLDKKVQSSGTKRGSLTGQNDSEIENKIKENKINHYRGVENKLIKWLSNMEHVSSPKGLARKIMDTYTAVVIRRALKDTACTSLNGFYKICDHHKSN